MKTDFFRKIDGVKGESADSQHGGEIDVEMFSWGQMMTTGLGSTGLGAGAGRVAFESLVIITRVSSASPQLALMGASGKHAPTAVLTARKAGGKQEEYYKVTFGTVFVTQYTSVAVAPTDLIPRDEIVLQFGQYVIEYRPQNKDGTLGSPILSGWSQITTPKPDNARPCAGERRDSDAAAHRRAQNQFAAQRAIGKGDWRRRMETASGKSEWNGESLFPFAFSNRSFHSRFPLAFSTRSFDLTAERESLPPPIT